MSEKLIVSLRLSVMDIEPRMPSIFFSSSAGMIPSQAMGIMVHFSFISAQSAFIRSYSQPSHWPAAFCDVKGG